eukprot:TRINITY_DN17812_c0_g1_i2.p1 TRINITY_DN17812_c0_g1~~TRINITY_DN17812_c0_g1_i2.p1  ORF type:complete len:796 (+),score=194.58 TRINITY_DN17812_c0_g1_i2:177-2564(+)
MGCGASGPKEVDETKVKKSTKKGGDKQSRKETSYKTIIVQEATSGGDVACQSNQTTNQQGREPPVEKRAASEAVTSCESPLCSKDEVSPIVLTSDTPENAAESDTKAAPMQATPVQSPPDEETPVQATGGLHCPEDNLDKKSVVTPEYNPRELEIVRCRSRSSGSTTSQVSMGSPRNTTNVRIESGSSGPSYGGSSQFYRHGSNVKPGRQSSMSPISPMRKPSVQGRSNSSRMVNRKGGPTAHDESDMRRRMLLKREGCDEPDPEPCSPSGMLEQPRDLSRFKRIQSVEFCSSASGTPGSAADLQPSNRKSISRANSDAPHLRTPSALSSQTAHTVNSGAPLVFPSLQQRDATHCPPYSLPVSIVPITGVKDDPNPLEQTLGSNYDDEMSSSSTSTSICSMKERVRRTMPGRSEMVENNHIELIEEAISLQQDYLEVDHCELVELPLSLRQLSENLTVLMATHNRLRVLPVFFAEFSQLRTLALSYNELEELPSDFGMLHGLVEVDLSHNRLRELPESFALLENLKMINLDFNDFHTFPEVALKPPHIEEFYLAENHHLGNLPETSVLREAKSLTQLAIDNIPELVKQCAERYRELLEAQPQLILWNKIWPDKVLDFMYIGSLRSAQTNTVYEKEGIKFVVTCGRNMQINNSGVVRLELGVEDVEGESLKPFFETFKTFVKASIGSGRVLVHCFAGLSRSATMVLSYLMSSEGMRLDKAMEHLMRVRPNVHPNPTFMKELILYDTELFPGERALDMTHLGEERTIRRLNNASTSKMDDPPPSPQQAQAAPQHLSV